MTTLPHTSFQAFIKRHPVLTYYALAFAISWGIMLLIIYKNGGVPETQEEFARQVSFMIPAMLGGPSVAAILMTALVSGKAGFHELFSRLLMWRVNVRWYAVALLSAPLVFVVVHTVLSLTSPVFLPSLITTTSGKAPFLLMGIVSALMVGFFEELGWTGFAIPEVRRRHGILATGLIVGVLWGLWHYPLFAGSGPTYEALFRAMLVPVLLSSFLPPFRVLMVWVYDRTESLLVAILMHGSLPVGLLIFMSAHTTEVEDLIHDLVRAAVLWLIVAAVMVVNRRTLARRSPRRGQNRQGAARPVPGATFGR